MMSSLKHFRTSVGMPSFPQAIEFRASLSSSRVGSLSVYSNTGKHSLAFSASLATTFSLELPRPSTRVSRCGGLTVFHAANPPSPSRWNGPVREGSITGVTRTCLSTALNFVGRDSDSRLFLEVDSWSLFSSSNLAVRQRRFKMRVLFLLVGRHSRSDELHLLKATVFKAPETRPQKFSYKY